MCGTDAAMQLELEAKARAVIAEIMAQKKAPGEITLTEIEQVVRRAGEQFKQALTAALVQQSAAQLESGWPTCAGCGCRMKAKGVRRKRLVTETGEVEIERAYYYCAHCRSGLFPPG